MAAAVCGSRLELNGKCRWRIWAPKAAQLELVLFDDSGAKRRVSMDRTPDDYFELTLPDIVAGQRYLYSVDGRDPRPDPYSQWQPEGVHRPSAVFDAGAHDWTDASWEGIARADLVIYELHVGTFTPEGTFSAIVPRLAELKDLGVTAIELMPVAQFPGHRDWGYDGVYLYAVQQSYGGPCELQRLIDVCHREGLAVILDVVYNHFGPEGNYLGEYCNIFTDRHHTPWGDAVNFDGPGAQPVRNLVLNNIQQWVKDFHVDGLRLDAIHAIIDDGPKHLLAEIKQVAEAEAAQYSWPVHVIAESNFNDVRVLEPHAAGGFGHDAQWSDDFHHCVHTLFTGEQQGYYADFDDPPAQLVKCLNEVFVYDGQFSPVRGGPHGRPAGDHPGDQFIISIQTHDQVGNRAYGERLAALATPAQQRLAVGLMLLAPHVPMLFMGEEYGEERPFPFFCDFGDTHLQEAVRQGRRQEFEAFAWADEIPDPCSEETFRAAHLSWSWPKGSRQAGLRKLYRDLLAARKNWPALRGFQRPRAKLINDGTAKLLLKFERGDARHSRQLLVAYFNLSDEPLKMPSTPHPEHRRLLRSEAEEYCAAGTTPAPADELLPFEFVVFGTT